VSEPKSPPETTAQAEQQAAPVQTQKPATARQEQRPVTMLPVTVTVEAEPLFDFDKYALRADSRKKLDDLVEQLKGVAYGEILTIGFADPIGSTLYNQRLSERRAQSVKQYLVNKGIAANTIRAEGRGETEEYAAFKDCGGLRKQKLITCLQPDRRVEVTVTAEKNK
jgi:OOP family OmpA-OmpF porin